MKVLALKILGFRGITEARLVFDDHFVFIGPNGVGKSTVIDALSLVFGRSRLVPTLTEHDFHGSCPDRAARVSIVATLGGFAPDDPESHRSEWFRQGRGIEKFWSATERRALPERLGASDPVCVEIGFCARFDHEELTVEQIRYFHDDDGTTDPFDDGVTLFPNALLNEVGFYVLPARRTWEMTVSFASELFRKAVTIVGGVPASAVLDIRNGVRAPVAPIENDAALRPLVEAVNKQLARLLPGQPLLQIRLTATDSESVLKALVPHYAFPGMPSLPAGRHGGGLLALQTLILLLETGRARRSAGQSFILALEEPELHVPPGLQRQIVSEARTIAQQTICTTHAPRVGASYTADKVHVMRRSAGILATNRLLDNPHLNLANATRKLLVDERIRLLEALMYPRILVPEGRIDFEFLRLFVEVAHGSEKGASHFETEVGTVPTPDSHVVGTVTRLMALRDGIFAVVDGDAAGDAYVAALISLPSPPLLIVQWPQDWTIEDVVAWTAAADAAVVRTIAERVAGPQMTSPSDLSARLKSDDRTAAGLKQHYLAYEEVAFALRDVAVCASRVMGLLEALADVASQRQSALFVADATRSTARTSVLRFRPA